MPLVDVAVEKWRQWREQVARGEESRKKVFQQIHDEARYKDCEKVAYLLWEADGKPEGNGERYYLEAQRRLKGVRWRLYQLHQPFISLEKKAIEPLDSWADRANIFQFFSKISPILEALGVLAIPFVILAFEFRQERRQQQFEERIISAQADVRQQQAVREYLSQVTTIHLESDQGKKLREDEELQKLLEANTLALFNELSVREDTRQDSNSDTEFDREAIAQDRKGQVVEFLSGLSWINGAEDQEPLLSLSKANLVEADLVEADLEGANLVEADLEKANLFRADLAGADLFRADLAGADLERANLVEADLERANLVEADLERANLFQADLRGADLFRADLRGDNLFRADLFRADLAGADLAGADLFRADLRGADLAGADLAGADLVGVRNLSNIQIKSACNWEQAVYTDAEFDRENWQWIVKDKQANQQRIESIREDKASDLQEPPVCG